MIVSKTVKDDRGDRDSDDKDDEDLCTSIRRDRAKISTMSN